MKTEYESIMDAALKLDAADRCRVADRLWESIGAQVVTLNDRDAELDADPSKEINHDEFMSSFTERRHS
jgi:hypothetical protein